jgi:hypothetical protein
MNGAPNCMIPSGAQTSSSMQHQQHLQSFGNSMNNFPSVAAAMSTLSNMPTTKSQINNTNTNSNLSQKTNSAPSPFSIPPPGMGGMQFSSMIPSNPTGINPALMMNMSLPNMGVPPPNMGLLNLNAHGSGQSGGFPSVRNMNNSNNNGMQLESTNHSNTNVLSGMGLHNNNNAAMRSIASGFPGGGINPAFMAGNGINNNNNNQSQMQTSRGVVNHHQEDFRGRMDNSNIPVGRSLYDFGRDLLKNENRPSSAERRDRERDISRQEEKKFI